MNGKDTVNFLKVSAVFGAIVLGSVEVSSATMDKVSSTGSEPEIAQQSLTTYEPTSTKKPEEFEIQTDEDYLYRRYVEASNRLGSKTQGIWVSQEALRGDYLNPREFWSQPFAIILKTLSPALQRYDVPTMIVQYHNRYSELETWIRSPEYQTCGDDERKKKWLELFEIKEKRYNPRQLEEKLEMSIIEILIERATGRKFNAYDKKDFEREKDLFFSIYESFKITRKTGNYESPDKDGFARGFVHNAMLEYFAPYFAPRFELKG